MKAPMSEKGKEFLRGNRNTLNRKKRIHSLTSPLPSKKTIVKTVNFLFNSMLLISFVWLQYWSIGNLFFKDIKYSVVVCGTVHKVFERPMHNSKTGDQNGVEKVIVMKYPYGYEEKNVNDETFYKAVAGERMCFEKRVNETKQNLSVLGMLAIVVIYIILIVSYSDKIKKAFNYLWDKLPD